MNRNHTRVFILGLDGADFDIIGPFVEAGKLPHIARLMREGAWGPLESTKPPITAPAWVSFMTGKNPGGHGVYSFCATELGTYQRIINDSTSIGTATLWDAIGTAGQSVCLIDIPMTYPPYPVQGVMVSGSLPSIDSDFTYPSALKSELLSWTGDFQPAHHIIRTLSSGDYQKGLEVLYRYTDSRRKAVFTLMEQHEWQVFMWVNRGTDILQHYAMPFQNRSFAEEHPREAGLMSQALVEYYEYVDRFIGELLDRLRPSDYLVVMSDHGAGPTRGTFLPNKWLIHRGYLVLRDDAPASRFGKHASRRGWKRLFSPRRTGKKASAPPSVDRMQRLVDWNKTRALVDSRATYSIRINLSGREPDGIVEPGAEYESLRDEISEGLLEIRDPHTDEQLIDRVYKKEEIYSGPYVDHAPDLYFEPVDMAYGCGGKFRGAGYVIQPRFPLGIHRKYGISILSGEGVIPGSRIQEARIVDLAPTVLYLMDLPVPDDMDGKVLKQAFDEGFLKSHPIESGPPIPFHGRERAGELTDQERRDVEDALRGLGYMD
jgi:predicted AlkP superfamily phosphohydrolase/phosphomutase